MWLKRLDNSAEVPQLMSGCVETGKPILQTPHSRTLVLYVSITTWSPLSMLLPTPISSQGQVHSCFRPGKTEITVRKFSQMYTLIIFYNLYNLCNIKKKCFFLLSISVFSEISFYVFTTFPRPTQSKMCLWYLKFCWTHRLRWQLLSQSLLSNMIQKQKRPLTRETKIFSNSFFFTYLLWNIF